MTTTTDESGQEECNCFRCDGSPAQNHPLRCDKYLDNNGKCTWRRVAENDFKKVLAGDVEHTTLTAMLNRWQEAQ